MKKYIFSGLVLGFLLLLPRASFAAIITDQPSVVSSSYTSGASNHEQQELGNGWSGTLDHVVLAASSSVAGTRFFSFQLCSATSTVVYSPGFCQSANDPDIDGITQEASGSVPFSGGGINYYHFDFSTVTLDPSRYYMLAMCATATSTIDSTSCALDVASDLNMSWYYSNDQPIGWPSYPVYWYQLWTQDVIPTPEIYLDTPTSSQVLPNFLNWTVHVNKLSSSTIQNNNTYGVGVWYSQASTTLYNLRPDQGNLNGPLFDSASVSSQFTFGDTTTQCFGPENPQNNRQCFQWDGGNSFYMSVPKFAQLTEGLWYAIPYVAYNPIVSQTTTTLSLGLRTELARGGLVSFMVSSTAALPAVSTSTNLAAGLGANNTSSDALGSGYGNTFITPVFTPNASTTSFFQCLYSGVSSTFNFWNGSDWQCLLYNTVDGLKNKTGDVATASFSAAARALSNVFPISILANFNNDIAIAKSALNGTSTPDIVLNEGHNPNLWRGHSFVLYSSSTTNWIKDHTGWDYRAFASNVLNLITGLVILLSSVAVLKRTFRHET